MEAGWGGCQWLEAAGDLTNGGCLQTGVNRPATKKKETSSEISSLADSV